MLHHLELIRDVGIETNEIQAARVVRFACRFAVGSEQPVTVNPSAPDDAMHFGQTQSCIRIGVQSIAGIGASNMRPNRAGQAETVLQMEEKIISVTAIILITTVITCIGLRIRIARDQRLALRRSADQS